LYETYQFEALAFEYVPTSASTNTGSVVLAPEYDPADVHTAEEGEAELLNMKNVKSGPPWWGYTSVLDPADLNKRKSLYTGTPGTSDESLRMHRAGSLIVGVSSNTSTAKIGELWVQYRLRLKTPHLRGFKSGDSDTGGAARFGPGSSNAAPFGTAVAEGGIPATLVVSGTTTSLSTFTFSQGWSGYAMFDITGADLGLDSNDGTCAVTTVFAFDNNTRLNAVIFLSADANETFIINLANTSVTAGDLVFVRGGNVTA
jgi:hypothetical protein